ncbi:MAG: threonine-phosphate decarboxylase [Nitrospirae bacterium]|nr:threonine-phosphate decarboxylase [Nitrospirota bacterium]
MKSSNGHGGNVYAAARELRRPAGTLLDFSASINPLGPSPKALYAIANGRSALSHYPDPDCWNLRCCLASRWKLSPDQIVVGNGSMELIHLLPQALAIRHALVIAPTFSEYARAVERAGGRVTLLPAKRREDYRPPLERAVRLLRSNRTGRKKIDAIFLCHPNSPTGQICDVNEVQGLVQEAERARTWTILDETFIEYCEKRSLLPRLSRFSRLIILRSFTKFYALPGLRIGYLVASERVACRVRVCQPPWSVNALAQVAAVESFKDQRHARRSLLYMEQERDRLRRRLGVVPGLTLFPSYGNFLLVELPRAHRASQIATTLRRQGVLIRDCSSVPGLNHRTVRIAVRTRRENNRLADALGELLR